MQDKEIVTGSANALTGKARFALTIQITAQQDAEPSKTLKRPFLEKLKELWSKPQKSEPAKETERTLIIYPCKVANMYRIAAAALQLPVEVVSGPLVKAILPLMSQPEILDTILYIVASGIQNNHLEPDKSLIDFLKLNLDHEDMFLLMHHTLDNVGMDSFLNSIVLSRGTVDILLPEASPVDGSE
jgi:hypothetical protein